MHSFEKFRHCGVFANLTDENSLIIFYIPNSSTFPSFNLFEGLFHWIEDYKTIFFNPFSDGEGWVVYDPYGRMYTFLPRHI